MSTITTNDGTDNAVSPPDPKETDEERSMGLRRLATNAGLRGTSSGDALS
jgi:hypothetical protein